MHARALKKYAVVVWVVLLLPWACLCASTTECPPEVEPKTVVGKAMKWYEEHITYGTIAVFMALESSFLPLPSEIIISPAAYLASEPDSELNFFLVILAATVGSLAGALLVYGLSAWLGRKALYKFADSRMGSFLMIDSEKVRHAEELFNRRSKASVCIGRFIAGIRMVISIPAGLAGMNLVHFSFFTFIGSAVYNTAIGLIGVLLQGQEDLIHKYGRELSTLTVIVTVAIVLVFAVRFLLLRARSAGVYGLIGQSLKHSHSRDYFTEKFKRERINARYKLYEIDRVEELKHILAKERVRGLNVTIPYKEQVMDYVDKLDETAAQVGAVNVLKITRFGTKLHVTGYNTDAAAFEQSLLPHLQAHHTRALVLGTGGASKAVTHVFRRLGIPHTLVSRRPAPGMLSYSELDHNTIARHTIIVNATPLGMYPQVDTFPDIPYDSLTDRHLLFDLVYNPSETLFLRMGRERGCTTVNGLEMFVAQAEAAWNIWNAAEHS